MDFLSFFTFACCSLLLKRSMFTQDYRNNPDNDECWRRGFSTVSQSGRSMIEKLGVPAIIGVFSVGGIAGYGKAMRMWNSNQQKKQLTQLLHSLIRLRYDLGHDRKYAEQRANVAAITPLQISQMCQKCKDQPYCSVSVSVKTN